MLVADYVYVVSTDDKFTHVRFTHKGHKFDARFTEDSTASHMIAEKGVTIEEYVAMNKSGINELIGDISKMTTEEIAEAVAYISQGGKTMFLDYEGKVE